MPSSSSQNLGMTICPGQLGIRPAPNGADLWFVLCISVRLYFYLNSNLQNNSIQFSVGLYFPTVESYRPGDIVPMNKMGQYHSSRTVWHDMIGRHCPLFAVNREVLNPIAKPTGYTGADAYEISFQVVREKFLIPWFLVINRKGYEVPLIDVHLRYSRSDLHGVTAKVIVMPHSYVETHPNIRKQFWDP
ncbi:hypothetical protein GIB67_033046 [Kingdonia uniflora]|uniref:Uncharacterized protein n=1 Tax=Kingdonia uniflora TaxID=39325 RepID=A0A7J7MYW4_9MAGN|nr:hypothetical protein GIB67_033046 [Kingdonia uniflora]